MAGRSRLRRKVRRKAPPVRRAPDPATRAVREKAAETGGLLVGGARDLAEAKADRMVAQVMSCGATAVAPAAGGGTLWREAASPVVAPGASAAPAPAGAARDVAALGAGQPLSADERGWFEPRLGADLSAVRVHEGATADRAARGLGARAFTAGTDVAFAEGARQPATMAHELAHVVTEGGAGALRRDLAIEPANPGAVAAVLTDQQRKDALDHNQRRFEDPFTIAIIRDVMGIAKFPAVIDDAFIDALVGWQAVRDLTQDGKFGPATTRTFLAELLAEGRADLATQLRRDNSVAIRNTLGPNHFTPLAGAAGTQVTGFEWDVAFKSSLRNGFLVQHIQSTWNENPAVAVNTPILDYWEAWPIGASGTSTFGTHPSGGDDKWLRPMDIGGQGNWTMAGTLFTVINLPARFQGPGGANHAADAGGLRSALNLTAANIDALGLPEGMLPIQVGNERARRAGGRWNFTGAPASWTHTAV